MAEAKKKTTTTKKSSNPVGRPKKKYGTETLMNNKKSFKLDNNNVVMDRLGDALVIAVVMLVVACLCLYFITK